jgi:hypothetical protein
MKYNLLTAISFFLFLSVSASDRDSTVSYHLPDSIRAVQFMAEITVTAVTGKKESFTGIQTDIVKLSLEAEKNEREIVFEFPASATVMATGLQVDAGEKGELEFDYNWSVNETYKLLIAVATDSADNSSLYTGYVWLPKESKWKLIGTCKINGRWTTLQNTSVFHTTGRKNKMAITTGQVWCLRKNGSWKNMNPGTAPSPVINLLSHIDSVEQRLYEKKQIEAAITSGKTDAKNYQDGVYYTLMKEGTGRQVSVTDMVVVHYKGYLFNDGSVFDQTSDKPVTFPLKRLIRGWQQGLPLCKVGGKIKLVIPSDLAYSIRTMAVKIPPNSILVFEIEVVDVNPTR